MTTLYTDGTVSLTNGSAVVAGIGTAWEIALIVGGIIYVQAEGNALPISSVESDTEITAAIQWIGATGTYSYALKRDEKEQNAKNAEILARVLAGMDAGIIWKYEAEGDEAGRDLYDNRPKGFSYLDVSVAPAKLWIKASNADGDWAGPFTYGQGEQGIQGIQGPIGPVGNRWRGTYSAGVSYLERDVVRNNGSAWIALQDTIGNDPPVFPTTANAFWELFAVKGTDGTGTGDIVGPSSSTNGGFVVFDGTTGKLLKTATAETMRTALGMLSTDVAFDNAAAGLDGSPATAQAAIEALAARPAGGGNPELALELSESKSAYVATGAVFADGFKTTGMVDVAGATNLATSEAGYLKPTLGSATQIANGAGTIIGDVANSPASAFNGTIPQDYTVCASISAAVANGYIGKNLSASPKRISSAKIFGATTTGLDGTGSATTITAVLRGKTGSAPASRTDGTSLGSWTGADASNIEITVTSSDTTTLWDYVWWDLTTAGSAPPGFYIAQVRFFEPGAPASMVVASQVMPSAAAPAKVSGVLRVVPVDAVTLNTDLVLALSRNNGVNWVSAPLTLAYTDGGVSVLRFTNVDLSGSPAGNNPRWRITTANAKMVKIDGVAVEFTA